jgi:hypothetical protein
MSARWSPHPRPALPPHGGGAPSSHEGPCGTPAGTPPVPTARTGQDRLEGAADLSCGDGSGGTQRTGLLALLIRGSGVRIPPGALFQQLNGPLAVGDCGLPDAWSFLSSTRATNPAFGIGTPPVVLAYEELSDSEQTVWNAIEVGVPVAPPLGRTSASRSATPDRRSAGRRGRRAAASLLGAGVGDRPLDPHHQELLDHLVCWVQAT